MTPDEAYLLTQAWTVLSHSYDGVAFPLDPRSPFGAGRECVVLIADRTAVDDLVARLGHHLLRADQAVLTSRGNTAMRHGPPPPEPRPRADLHVVDDPEEADLYTGLAPPRVARPPRVEE